MSRSLRLSFHNEFPQILLRLRINRAPANRETQVLNIRLNLAKGIYTLLYIVTMVLRLGREAVVHEVVCHGRAQRQRRLARHEISSIG